MPKAKKKPSLQKKLRKFLEGPYSQITLQAADYEQTPPLATVSLQGVLDIPDKKAFAKKLES